MHRERAASALERGLPAPTPQAKHDSASAAPRPRPSSHPSGRGRPLATTNERMPLAVKLLGLGLGLLGLVYGLTLFRDHKSTPASAAARVNASEGPVSHPSVR